MGYTSSTLVDSDTPFSLTLLPCNTNIPTSSPGQLHNT